MIESNLISKILKEYIIHNCNYLINKKHNVISKKYMNKKSGYKKQKYICFVNVINLNKHLTCNFDIIREEILNSLTNKVEKNFV